MLVFSSRIPSPRAGNDGPSDPATPVSANPEEKRPKPSAAISGRPAYGRELWDDTRTVLTAPSRWDRTDLLTLTKGAAAVAGTALLLDQPVRSFVERNSSDGAGRLADQIAPFGSTYSFGVLAAFYGGGVLADSETAVTVAKDGLTSSLIASGILSPILKISAGRSRPSADEGAFDFHPFSGQTSFPSGHTTQAFAVGSVIAEHYDAAWIDVASYGLASLVGLARLEQNAHFASDVLAGALIGTSVGKSIVRLNGHSDREIAVFPLAGPELYGVAAELSF